MELMIVVAVMGIIVAWTSPRFEVAVEQTRVDAAGSALHSIWIGQRLHFLESGSYAADLSTLESQLFLDSTLLAVSDPFAFSIESASATVFEAQAVRGGSGTWSGTLTIDEAGALSGSTQDGEGHVVEPLSN
jgi:Tfp pilus assembly protein PilE